MKEDNPNPLESPTRSTQNKQLDDIKDLIGTYRHEFGNGLAIIEGKLFKLTKEWPDLATNESILIIQKWTARLTETVFKLDQLRHVGGQKPKGK